MPKLKRLAPLLLTWHALHGRHHLPWQVQDPYRVWLSEIMLQQTQVATVMGYYARFLARFPTVHALAESAQSEVLALWSGLGYYARARNLHRAAQIICSDWGGQFPPSAAALATLPGIGRSTANAIAAFCYQERVAILDANVKRVLSRYTAFSGDLAQKSKEAALWELANKALPRAKRDMPAYTQGLMDLGATLCLPRKPQCETCPLHAHCLARQEGEPERYPLKSRKLVRKEMTLHLLLCLQDAHDDTPRHILLQQREQNGIWAGLYTPPLFDSAEALRAFIAPMPQASTLKPLAPLSHQLTHRDMTLIPQLLTLQPTDTPAPYYDGNGNDEGRSEGTAYRWFPLQEALSLGLPAPIRTLLQDIIQCANKESIHAF